MCALVALDFLVLLFFVVPENCHTLDTLAHSLGGTHASSWHAHSQRCSMYQVIEHSVSTTAAGASERAHTHNYFSYFPFYAFATFLTLFLIILFYIILFSSSSSLLLFCLRFPFYVWVSVVVHLHGLGGKTECKHKFIPFKTRASDHLFFRILFLLLSFSVPFVFCFCFFVLFLFLFPRLFVTTIQQVAAC